MPSPDPLGVLEVAARNELESLLIEFDGTWNPNLLDQYGGRLASNADEEYRRLALAELVKIDLQRSWATGKGRQIEEYLQQFPMLGNSESVNSELIAAEYDARIRVNGELSLATYKLRFPRQFDEVKDQIRRFKESNRLSSSPVRGTQREIQASIDTSRVDQMRDTKDGNEPDSIDELPVEFGRYRILKELGSGAMGKVYLAHDSQLDRQVALKTPSFSGTDHDDMVTRFYREARAAAKLHHRNICPIYDVGEIGGRHFISMAFVKGRCMSDFIKPDKLPPERTSAILVQRLAVALSEAHKHSVIHRDLKPANIMIDLKKEPIVMDFGLARQMDTESRVTQTGMAVGTPAYMSPEQIRGELNEVGPAADIYALGVILYELLTGRLPFQGPIAKVVYGIVHEEPAAPSSIRKSIDSKLESICAKMMAKNSAERFQSMEQVARALKAYVKGESQTQESALSSAKESSASPVKSSTNSVTETGALNAFFAAHSEATASGTQIEPSRPVVSVQKSDPPQLLVRPNSSSGNRRVRRRLLIASGFAGGILGLLGIVIYFNGGRVELDDDSDAIIEVTEQGTLLITPPQPQPNNPSSSSTQNAIWEDLIDPTLSNWVRFPSRSLITNDWLVNNGVLRMARAASGDICTKKLYSDFELEFEWKVGKDGNSGVIYRVAPGSQVSWQAGPEYQIYDDFNAPGSLKQEQRTGAIYGLFPPKNAIPKPVGEWNQSRIIAHGPHIEHWLNGSKVAEAEIGNAEWEAASRSYGRVDNFPNFAKAESGYIVLQSHRSEIAYRNIRLREIDSERQVLDANLGQQSNTEASMGSSAAAPSNLEVNAGFVRLFPSDNFDGWSGLFDRWRLENGELLGSAPKGVKLRSNTVLCSDKSYRDFELRFDALLEGEKRKDGPNSGIQFRSTLLHRTDYKVGGPQLDIGGRYEGGLWGENTAGLMFQPDSALIARTVDSNNWNSYRLRVEGERVTIHINETQIVDREFPGIPEDGLIGFQLHRGKVMSVRFRNMRIKELHEEQDEANLSFADPSPPAVNKGPSTADRVDLINEWEHGGQHSSNWHVARLSPGGRNVAFRLGDGPLQISDVSSKQMSTVPPEMENAISLAYSADGRLIATGHDDKSIRLWDAESFEPIGEPFISPIEQTVLWVYLSADGTKLISMGNDHSKRRRTSTFHTWEIATRKLVSRFEADIDSQQWAKSIDASADGTLVAVVSHREGPKLWDTRTGEQVPVVFDFDERLAGMMRITGLDLSSDGTRLAYGTLWGGPSYAAILDTSSGKELWNSGTQGGRVHCVQFTSDGRWLATTAGRTQAHQLSLWDVQTGDEVKRWEYDYESKDDHASTVKFLSFSEDGSKLLLAGGHMPVAVWGITSASADERSGESPNSNFATYANSRGADLSVSKDLDSTSELLSEDWQWSSPTFLGKFFQESRQLDEELGDNFTTWYAASSDDDSHTGAKSGFGKLDIWSFSRQPGDPTWEEPVNLGDTVNSASNENWPTLSRDGLKMLFSSDRDGAYDIWMTTRTSTEDVWSEPFNLGQWANSGRWDSQPSFGENDNAIYFASDRNVGHGGKDLYVTRLHEKQSGRWANSVNLGPQVNTVADEMCPVVSDDGLVLLFSSQDRPGGLGGHDIWMSWRNAIDDTWSTPVVLGSEINTDGNEFPKAISLDGRQLVFDRFPIEAQDDEGSGTWAARRVPK